MARETFKLGVLAITEGEFKGRKYRSIDDIDMLAEKVLDLLRPEALPVCQVKDVMDRVCQLIDFTPFT